jgi:bacteriorhodopsin
MPFEFMRPVIQSSFLLVFIAFAATSLFLFLERDRVPDQFRTTMRVATVYIAIAAVNYLYMKDVYAAGAGSDSRFPTQIRYIDWFLTTPLMLLKFPLMLGVGKKGVSFMTRLVLLDIAMIVTGYIGEISASPAMHYGFFLLGCIAWLLILVSLFIALGTLPERIGPALRQGVRTMGLFVVVGWAIYPLGYFAPILGLPGDVRELLYNVADLVNKVGLCLVVYVTAKQTGMEERSSEGSTSLSPGGMYDEGAEAAQ